MPIVPSEFNPPAFLRNGHVQTVAGALLRSGKKVGTERTRLELPDGDFLDLDWLRAGRPKLVILSHGLEGSSANRYILGMAAALAAVGWDALAWNFRGCGDEPNRLLRFYHSGETEDLRAVIQHAAAQYATIALIGFSLGGNLTLKYLGEAPPHPAIRAGVTFSVPVDLAASAGALDGRRANRIYLRRFLTTLVAKVEAKALRFPDQLNAKGARGIRSFREFDDRYTAPLHGFRDAADYWRQSSARQFLPRITTPTLLVQAKDDPFLTEECFPWTEAAESASLTLEIPQHGGHVGFVDLVRGTQPWSEHRAAAFLSTI